jgi:acyl-coenzyme A synthetase/AMP-(fatty) acid ligase
MISVKNSPDAIKHLMHSTGSAYLLVDDTLKHLRDEISQRPGPSAFKTLVISPQPLAHNVSEDGLVWISRFLGSARWSDEQLRAESLLPAVYMHTSGSTGMMVMFCS